MQQYVHIYISSVYVRNEKDIFYIKHADQVSFRNYLP